MSTLTDRSTRPLHRLAFHAATVTVAATLALGLAGCENSVSKMCKPSTGPAVCKVELKGSSRVELPPSKEAKAAGHQEIYVDILSAKADGTATFLVRGIEATCRAGQTVSLPGTTIECTHVAANELHVTYTAQRCSVAPC